MPGPLGPGTVNSFSMESLCFPRFSWDCRETKFTDSPRDQSLTVKYSTPDIGNEGMIISYGDSFWPGTSLRPGENRSEQLDQARFTRWIGGCVPFPFSGLELSDGMEHF